MLKAPFPSRKTFIPLSPWLALLSLGALLIAPAPGESAAPLIYRCVLSGMQEVGPNASPAIGGGEFRIDTQANTITYRIVYSGLLGAETAAHVHGMADPGVNAGVIAGLPLGSPKTGVFNYAQAQEADILAGKTYVNVHTGLFPGGEIRGQIVPLNAMLDAGQEVPANPSTAMGWGTFNIDTVANELSYHIVFSGLLGVETSAHIHGAAPHGGNAGVFVGLPLGTPKIGSWTYANNQEADILAGRTYVNIHSTAFPGGEIRGQIVPIVAVMDEGQEVPATGSAGAGIALVSIDQPNDILGYDIRMTGLGGVETSAHIHGYAPPGINAGVVTGLPLGLRKIGTWNYPAGDEASIEAGLTYINIHTTLFPGGEIRGQIQGFDSPPVVGVPELFPDAGGSYLENFPNPFVSATTIRFNLARSSAVDLSITDVTGRRVRSLVSSRALSAGPQSVSWDGRNDRGAPVSSGVYFYVLETQEGVTSRAMTIVR